jgi:hypothetical protein
MWLSDARFFCRRRALLLVAGGLAATPLAACFRPMLAEGGHSSELIGQIELPAFDDRFGYYLSDSLRDRLGRPEVAVYRLDIKTRLHKDNLAIAQDNAVTRISLTASADWALYRLSDEASGADGKPIPALTGRTVSQSGYNSTASLYATRAAKLDIERRLARDLGERIARSLFARAGTLASRSQGQASPPVPAGS